MFEGYADFRSNLAKRAVADVEDSICPEKGVIGVSPPQFVSANFNQLRRFVETMRYGD